MTKYNALAIALQVMETCVGPEDIEVEQAIDVLQKMKDALLQESRKKRQYYVKKTCEGPTQAASEFCKYMEGQQ